MTILAGPPELIRCKPSDVVAVRTPGIFGRLIRFGASIEKHPDTINHIAVVHHVTANVVWGIEGRPGGVGWVNMAKYFEGPLAKYTVTNWHQPRTPQQRAGVCTLLRAALGDKYDWESIGMDALEDLVDKREFPKLMDHWWRDADGTDAHFVCSSLAAYAYDHNGLASPNYTAEQNIQPYDWEMFIEAGGFYT